MRPFMSGSSDHRNILDTHVSRREFAKKIGYGAAAWCFLPRCLCGQSIDFSSQGKGGAGINSAYPSDRVFLAKGFDLADVQLLNGPFKQAMDLNAKYLLSLEPDRF